jgi:hypothetical protein
VLSNGERSIGSAMNETGKTPKAGQSVRILNIPLFGSYGAFNELHDKEGGRALADHLLTASSEYASLHRSLTHRGCVASIVKSKECSVFRHNYPAKAINCLVAHWQTTY